MHVINMKDLRVTPWFNGADAKVPADLKVVPADLYTKYVAGEIKDAKALLNAVLLAESGNASTETKRGRKTERVDAE